ncbi:MAG: CBS domain-containing protein [Bacteroidota bacterium]
MNLLAPVSSIMTTDLITVNPKDKLAVIKSIFDQNRIHHIPVVRFRKLIGLISHVDLQYFLKGLSKNNYEDVLNEIRLKNYFAEDIMTTGLATLAPSDRINIALAVFNENRFHAIPIVENDALVGMLTTYDIIKALSREKVSLEDYRKVG